MPICCDNPIVRIEKIKDNQNRTKGVRTEQVYSTQPDSAEDNKLPRNDMTSVVSPADPPEGSQEGSGGEEIISPEGNILYPNTEGSSGAGVFENPPYFKVPANPLLPEGYQEVLDYNNLQYANGFYRTQIGRFVEIEQLVSSNSTVIRYGYLIGVGINYILLQDPDSSNVLVIDAFSIKSMEVYYKTNSRMAL